MYVQCFMMRLLTAVFVLCVSICVDGLTTPSDSTNQSHVWVTESRSARDSQCQACTCPSNNSQQLACSEEASSDSCPPGLFCKGGQCECMTHPNYIIKCNGTRSFVFKHLCATFSEENNATVVGACPFAYILSHTVQEDKGEELRYELPASVHELQLLCNSSNREGTLCGRCQAGHYPLAYSFNLTCIPCPHVLWNWVKYVAAAYVPLTLFCIIILLFRINTTSSYLFPVVFYCQTVALPFLFLIVNFGYISKIGPVFYSFARILLSLYGIWSLDFFRPYYSNLCLGIGIFPTIALDYAIAAYPLILMLVCYLLIVLQDKKCRAVRAVWKPLRKLSSLFKQNWDVQTSIIDAFATFFFLSSYKFLIVSFQILTPTSLYLLYPNYHGHLMNVYFAADVVYFSKQHLPYAVLAIAVLLIFVVLPFLVLMLYPSKLFHRCLNRIPVRWSALHIVMDSFQGCYKDGTQPGTCDCRWFSSLFLLSRVCMLMLYVVTKDVRIFLVASSMLLVVYITLIAIFQPFKPAVSHYNISNSMLFLFLCLFMISACGFNMAVFLVPHLSLLFAITTVLFGVIPILYIAAILLFWTYKHRTFGFNLMQQLRAWKAGYRVQVNHGSEFPDRMENPENYPAENLANFSTSGGTT